MLPKIFNNTNNNYQGSWVADLRINSILSDNSLSFLSVPCNRSEILQRQELFGKIIKKDGSDIIQSCLSMLKSLDRTRELLNNSHNELERLHYRIEQYEIYIDTVKSFTALNDYGILLSQIAVYFNNQMDTVSEMLDATKHSKNKLQPLMSGLISLQDKIWVTPDHNVTDDYELIKNLVITMGLEAPKRKRYMLTVENSLSDAICSMYKDNLEDIRQNLDKFEHINCFEVLKYIPELEFISEIVSLVKRASGYGIDYCFPKVADEPSYFGEGVADITLITKGTDSIVINDVDFREDSFSFLIGANSGGKTTYLRAVAVNLILFLSGCPIFAKNAEIFPFDFVGTHFTSDERYNDTGRLDDELNRIEEMIKSANKRCAFLFFNETFSGTDDKRGFELLKSTVRELKRNNHFGLWVTHFSDVLTLGEPILTVKVGENNCRTYRVERLNNVYSSYANDILRKYGIDGESLRKRRKS